MVKDHNNTKIQEKCKDGNKIVVQNGEILIRLDIKTVVVSSFAQTINSHTGKNLAWQIKSISKKIDYIVYVEPLEKR